jgi:hypothetical protein
MPRAYDEKRDAVRVDVDCPIMFRPEDNGGNEIGKVRNLSGRGMMFISHREVLVESHLEVRIQPEDETPSLHARVRVVRVAKPRRGEGFEIGAVIQEMLDE